jgi:hypothetical protein
LKVVRRGICGMLFERTRRIQNVLEGLSVSLTVHKNRFVQSAITKGLENDLKTASLTNCLQNHRVAGLELQWLHQSN